jgi:DNA-binding SARP family transcriptional activator/EAL domain-containing protein (putative c-di-GMP-specific phosphodiesterase class I)
VRAPATRITLLGRTAIERDGAIASTLTGRRAELVFAYLAVEHHRSVSRDELADALWPDVLPDTWNAALRSVLSDVRRTLERAGIPPADALLTEHGRVRLQLPPGTTIDVEEAHAGLSAARSAMDLGDAARAACLASAAAKAASATFLPFHDEGWASEVRGRLEALHIDALLLAGQAHTDAGDPHAALSAADRLVRADPFLEAGHRLRIASLGSIGDRAGALKAYERCKAILEAELAIGPSPETADVLSRALQGSGPARETRPAPSSEPLSRYGRLSVLVVEDHDFQRRTTLTLLRGLGVGTLLEAEGGTAALALIDASSAPDVIVCDIDMPEMDGVEFIRHVAERGLASAVVIASGLEGRVLETVRAASQGYGLQVLGAVAKPLTTASLERMLAAYRPSGAEAAAPEEPSSGSVGELVQALRDGTLGIEFEPIVDLAVGRVAALRGHVPSPFADELPRAADAACLARPLVERMLLQTTAAARTLDVDAFVDLTPGLLTDVSVADALSAITRERVVLVASAQALAAADSPAMLDVLARLRIKGFGLCVDGLDPEGLDRYPLTHIALPPELIVAAAATGELAPLQPAIDASRRLHVPMIGRCESGAEFELLLRLGCSFAYGRFMAAAVPAGQVTDASLDWVAPPAVELR